MYIFVSCAEEVRCDFESLHVCYFTQDRTDDMDWVLGSGSTPSYETGPSFDHTYGNSSGGFSFKNHDGYLLYFGLSQPCL